MKNEHKHESYRNTERTANYLPGDRLANPAHLRLHHEIGNAEGDQGWYQAHSWLKPFTPDFCCLEVKGFQQKPVYISVLPRTRSMMAAHASLPPAQACIRATKTPDGNLPSINLRKYPRCVQRDEDNR